MPWECAEHRGVSYGLVAPLYEQGKVLARVICGREAEPYGGSIPYSQLKVSGVDVFSAGVISGKVLKRPFSITMPYAAHTKSDHAQRQGYGCSSVRKYE